MLKFLRAQHEKLLQERAGFEADLDGIVTAAESEQRSALTEEETSRFDELRSKITAHDADIAEVEARIADAEKVEERRQREAESRKATGQTGPGSEERTAPGRVTSEPNTYRKDDPTGPSFVRDLFDVGLGRPGAAAAHERLQRNNREVVVEARALSTTDGAGGDFVPPLWLVNQFVELARTARPTADRVQNQPLPGGTDSINVPRIATGTAVAEQATQNTAVQNTDLTTASVTANVATIAGQQVVAIQLLEQSAMNLDGVILPDLAADYAAKVDLFVLNNNAAGKKGLLQEAGTNAVTYTDADPTVGELYSKIADAIQQVTTGRFMPPDTIIMHPRRWAWMLAAADTAGRPLIVPTAGQNAQNALGTAAGVATANGVVGNIAGLDVVLDPQIPTNLGVGTNEDRIIVLRAADSILWEGVPHADAFREPLAAQLSVLFRFYRYAAFTTARYVKSVSVIAGTGLVAPTF